MEFHTHCSPGARSMGFGRFITGICERAGTVPVGLLCNGAAGLLMKLGESGNWTEALKTVGIGTSSTAGAILVIATLGGMSLVNACKDRSSAKQLADQIDAIGKSAVNDRYKLEQLWHAVSASGVTLATADKLDLQAALDACVKQNLADLPDRVLRSLRDLGEVVEKTDPAAFESLESGVDKLTGQIQGVEDRLAKLLAAIATDAKTAAEQATDARAEAKRGADAAEAGRDLGKEILREVKSRTHSSAAPLWTIPPLPSNRIDRAPLVKSIRAALANGGTASLAQAVARGGGGYGKSVAAILYAHAHEKDYPGGSIWVDAAAEDASETPGTPEEAFVVIARGLGNLADTLGIPEAGRTADAKTRGFADPDSQLAAACAVSAFLESRVDKDGVPARALLVLDNLSAEAHWTHGPLRRLLPRRNVDVLVTTRRERMGSCPRVHVDKLTPREAVSLLQKYVPEGADTPPGRSVAAHVGVTDADLDGPLDDLTKKDAAWGPVLRLARHVEFIAVYVAAIGAYVRNTPGATWAVYWQDVASSPIAAIPAEADGINTAIEYPRHLHRILDDAIRSLPPAERAAMEYAAFLPVRGFPAFWLEDLLAADATVTLAKTVGVPGSPARAVLEHLVGLDMLRGSTEKGGFVSPHRVYAAHQREQLACNPERRGTLLDAVISLGERRGEACRRDAVAGRPNITDEAERSSDRERLRTELTPLMDLASVLDEVGRTHAGLTLANIVHSPLFRLGRYADATSNLSPYVNSRRQWDQLANRQSSNASHSGPLSQMDENPSQARSQRLPVETKAATFADSMTTSYVLACAFSNLSLIKSACGDFVGARDALEKATAIDLSDVKAEDSLAAAHYCNLAILKKDIGDLPGARTDIHRAIAFTEQHLGIEHPLLATMLSNLATIQHDLLDLREARLNIERAMRINTLHRRTDDPAFASMYSNLALIQADQGELYQASGNMMSAIAIVEKHLGTRHPDLGTLYSNLAAIQQKNHELLNARSSIEKAFKINSNHFNSDHPNIGFCHNVLAMIEYHDGQHVSALVHFKKSLEILLKHFDATHPHVQTVLASIKVAESEE